MCLPKWFHGRVNSRFGIITLIGNSTPQLIVGNDGSRVGIRLGILPFETSWNFGVPTYNVSLAGTQNLATGAITLSGTDIPTGGAGYNQLAYSSVVAQSSSDAAAAINCFGISDSSPVQLWWHSHGDVVRSQLFCRTGLTPNVGTSLVFIETLLIRGTIDDYLREECGR